MSVIRGFRFQVSVEFSGGAVKGFSSRTDPGQTPLKTQNLSARTKNPSLEHPTFKEISLRLVSSWQRLNCVSPRPGVTAFSVPRGLVPISPQRWQRPMTSRTPTCTGSPSVRPFKSAYGSQASQSRCPI